MRFQTFTTQGVALKERYEAWRERAWPSMAKMMRTDKPSGEFYSHIRSYQLGSMVLQEARMTGQTYTRTSQLIRSDGMDGISLGVSLAGRVHGETAVGSYKAGPNSVLFGDLSAPYTHNSTNAHYVTLVFNRKDIQRLVPHIDGLHGLVMAGKDAAPVVRQVTSLLQQLPDASDEIGTHLGDGLTGAFLSLLNSTGTVSLSEEAHLSRLRTEVRWIIQQRFREADLDVARIAAMSKVSRATLYRAFSNGEGISAYVTRVRLQMATAALADPGDVRLISEIALSVGFDQVCNFNRAFRRIYGCTPRDWRHHSRTIGAAA